MKYGLNCNIVTLYFYSIVRTQAKINEQAELINDIIDKTLFKKSK
jgi:hypothetical protein